jgi:MinD-like ATPase involved in chromosome partitioning or flagellar assembly
VSVITVLLAARSDRVQQWYQGLVRDRRFQVLSYATSAEELVQRATMRPQVLVLDAGLYGGPQLMAEALRQLPVGAIYVILPTEASVDAETLAASVPSVLKVWKGKVSMSTVADTVYRQAVAQGQTPKAEEESAKPTPAPQARRATQAPAPSTETEERVVAFWSGPAGGTGRTTLALMSAIQAVEWGADAGLVALSEPSLSAMLPVSRVPNALTFLEQQGQIQATEQVVSWPNAEGEPVALPVVLGPPRPRDGAAVDEEGIVALLTAVREAHRLVLIDLPALVPGPNVWGVSSLQQATDVVLVAPPIASGAAATVEALATLEELEAGARVHLVVNRPMPDGLSPQHLVDGVTSVWGSCPGATVQVPYLAELPVLLSQGKLPESKNLVTAIGPLVETALGVERPVPVEEAEPRKKDGQRGAERAIHRSARQPGDQQRLIRIRLK